MTESEIKVLEEELTEYEQKTRYYAEKLDSLSGDERSDCLEHFKRSMNSKHALLFVLDKLGLDWQFTDSWNIKVIRRG